MAILNGIQKQCKTISIGSIVSHRSQVRVSEHNLSWIRSNYYNTCARLWGREPQKILLQCKPHININQKDKRFSTMGCSTLSLKTSNANSSSEKCIKQKSAPFLRCSCCISTRVFLLISQTCLRQKSIGNALASNTVLRLLSVYMPLSH